MQKGCQCVSNTLHSSRVDWLKGPDMHGNASARTLAFPMVSTPDDLPLDPLPRLPNARDLRRARLVAHLARKRVMYQMLHIALGLTGWAMIGGAAWGVVVLVG